MKAGLLVTIILLGASAMAATNEIQTWTSIAGTKMEARFVKEKYGTVYLETADGAVKEIKLSNLSEKDRRRVAELTDPFAAKKAERARVAAATPEVADAIRDLFGTTLRNCEKDKVSTDTLGGKTIGIYFSAHWCPPCRAFTPVLVDFHNTMTDLGKPFEVVFVSSDHDANAMYGYMREMEMPWLALDYGSSNKEMLKKKYSVRGIPKLVIINADGETITENGRGDVSRLGEKAFDQWN